MKTTILHITDTYVARTVNDDEDGTSVYTLVPFEDVEPVVVKAVQAAVMKLDKVDVENLRVKQEARSTARIEQKRAEQEEREAAVAEAP